MAVSGQVMTEKSCGQADLAWGVDEIAKAIGRTERATFHLLAKGQLPARKVGGRWVASRRKLLSYILGEAEEQHVPKAA